MRKWMRFVKYAPRKIYQIYIDSSWYISEGSHSEVHLLTVVFIGSQFTVIFSR